MYRCIGNCPTAVHNRVQKEQTSCVNGWTVGEGHTSAIHKNLTSTVFFCTRLMFVVCHGGFIHVLASHSSTCSSGIELVLSVCMFVSQRKALFFFGGWGRVDLFCFNYFSSAQEVIREDVGHEKFAKIDKTQNPWKLR